jgi:hypothetical protein
MTLLKLKVISDITRTAKLGMTLLKLKLTGDITRTANAGDDTSEIEIDR